MRIPYIFLLLLSLPVFGGLLPDYDKRCDCMSASQPEIMPHRDPLLVDYFNAPIPKKVHQIWYGNAAKRPQNVTATWQEYSKAFGYSYKLWTEADDDQLRAFMNPENFDLLMLARNKADYCAASDIVRYELLKHFGGIYVDCDIPAPKDQGKLVDLKLLAPMRGLVLTTEWHARNVGTSAIFVLSGFIMCCPHHPLMEHLTKSVSKNVLSIFSHGKPLDAMYMTGPFLLNKILTGSFTVISPIYLNKFGML
ncbi:MAG: hypothetical protein LLG04_11485 [Parachlamydia sp.]|nr:hypothetical protein [Parachlamydia sp.]